MADPISIEDSDSRLNSYIYIFADASCQVVGATTDQQINLSTQPDQTITISSHNYPGNYGTMIHCLWYFTAPSGSVILFKIVAFATEATDDPVRIGSGADYRANPTTLVQELSGTVTTPVTHQVASTAAWMTFSSDLFTTATGFQIEISAANP